MHMSVARLRLGGYKTGYLHLRQRQVATKPTHGHVDCVVKRTHVQYAYGTPTAMADGTVTHWVYVPKHESIRRISDISRVYIYDSKGVGILRHQDVIEDIRRLMPVRLPYGTSAVYVVVVLSSHDKYLHVASVHTSEKDAEARTVRVAELLGNKAADVYYLHCKVI